jgi:hypothetical protein
VIPDDELRHLARSLRPGERPGGVGTVAVLARCPDAARTRDRAAEVMTAVLTHGRPVWPPEADWAHLLPAWFVEACGPELSPAAAEERMRRWRALPPAAQARASAEERWSLANWLFWLEPDERQWFWWDAQPEGGDSLRVTVEIPGWPAPLGALGWLLRAAGATEVTYED